MPELKRLIARGFECAVTARTRRVRTEIVGNSSSWRRHQGSNRTFHWQDHLQIETCDCPTPVEVQCQYAAKASLNSGAQHVEEAPPKSFVRDELQDHHQQRHLQETALAQQVQIQPTLHMEIWHVSTSAHSNIRRIRVQQMQIYSSIQLPLFGHSPTHM